MTRDARFMLRALGRKRGALWHRSFLAGFSDNHWKIMQGFMERQKDIFIFHERDLTI